MRQNASYERRHEKLAPLAVLYRRLVWNLVIAVAMIGISLAVGMAGYAYFEDMGALDAFLNASMILAGMGPVDAMKSDGGKLCAGL